MIMKRCVLFLYAWRLISTRTAQWLIDKTGVHHQ